MTTTHHLRRSLGLAAAAAGASILVGCADDPSETRESNARVAGVQQVAPAMSRYDTNRVQALWADNSLAARDRSLATVAVHVANGQTAELGFYVDKALDDGLTPAEISETVTHLASYSGWPNAMAAIDPLLNHLAYFTGWPKVFSAMPVVAETLRSR